MEEGESARVETCGFLSSDLVLCVHCVRGVEDISVHSPNQLGLPKSYSLFHRLSPTHVFPHGLKMPPFDNYGSCIECLLCTHTHANMHLGKRGDPGKI